MRDELALFHACTHASTHACMVQDPTGAMGAAVDRAVAACGDEDGGNSGFGAGATVLLQQVRRGWLGGKKGEGGGGRTQGGSGIGGGRTGKGSP